eukprot:COSAG06_NODE_17819_length_919_cov_5.081707_1_plen_225_part_10
MYSGTQATCSVPGTPAALPQQQRRRRRRGWWCAAPFPQRHARRGCVWPATSRRAVSNVLYARMTRKSHHWTQIAIDTEAQTLKLLYDRVDRDVCSTSHTSVGAGDVVEAAEPEPELEDAQEAAAVAQCQRLAAMVAQESGAGSPPAPVQCVVRLIVGFPGYQGGQGFGARGFSFASLIKTGILVWDRSGLGEELLAAQEWETETSLSPAAEGMAVTRWEHPDQER